MSKNMKYFRFRQNNSGGSFVKDKAVDVNVIVESGCAVSANGIAESIGIYFCGVDAGMDCECCGDRWSPVNDGKIDGYERLTRKQANGDEFASETVRYNSQGKKVTLFK